MNLHLIERAAKTTCVGTTSFTGFASAIQQLTTVIVVRDGLEGIVWASALVAAVAGLIWLYAKTAMKRGMPIYSTEPASDPDFQNIRALGVRFFGPKVSTVEQMGKWVERHPGIFHVVTKELRAGSRRVIDVTGYYCALPLGKQAADDIRSNRKTVNDLDAKDLCAPGSKPSAIYIGSVVSTSPEAGSCALLGLRNLVLHIARRRGDIPIIARPVTPDGMRLAKAFGMEPVGVTGRYPIGVVHVGTLGKLLRGGRLHDGGSAAT